MKKAVIGLLGPTLDRGMGADRWNHWRPSVSIFQHEDLLIDRFDLIYQRKYENLLKTIIEDIHSISPETEVNPHEVNIDDAWDFQEVYGTLHDFSREYDFDTDQFEYLVHISTGTHVLQICMFLLTESRHIPGKLLQTSPPFKRGLNPGTYAIIDLDLSKYDRIAQRFHHERNDSLQFLKSGIETKNSQFNQLIEKIEHVAVNSKEPILLTGPTGAGKSQLARRIYELKKLRRQVNGPFVEVNCSTLRGDSAMSTLFGHKKGSFTGALQDREGLLRKANGGMLFLDEIGELGLDEQTMLLRAIEEKCFMPLGADQEVSSSFQLICGTNRDLYKDVNESRFRQDLLARIHLWSFRLPGLAERRDDIEPNIEYEIDQLAQREGKFIRFNKEALRLYLKFSTSNDASWNFNFRDLSSSISRMATFALSGRITQEIVQEETELLRKNWNPQTKQNNDVLLVELLGDAYDQIDPFDLVQLSYVVKVCAESQSLAEAGRKLFQATRDSKKKTNDSDRLRKYLLKFDIRWDQLKEFTL